MYRLIDNALFEKKKHEQEKVVFFSFFSAYRKTTKDKTVQMSEVKDQVVIQPIIDNTTEENQNVEENKPSNELKRNVSDIEPSKTDTLPPPLQQDIKRVKLADASDSESPISETFTSNSRSEINQQINDLKNLNNDSNPNSNPNTNTNTPLPSTNITDTKQNTTTKDECIKQSGRKIENIIDGSDLRKFLNISISENLIKSINNIVELWENSDTFNTEIEQLKQNDNLQNRNILKKKVLLRLADELKDLASEL